ncbi:MAG TPA: hypothetical protein VER96_07085 [Polyangiaceae bacterium]|nr:hypothetical protein [Polyangiaceae bacterium]
MKTLWLSSLLSCSLCACSSSTPPAQSPANSAPPAGDSPHRAPPGDSPHEAGPVGTQLVRDVTDSPDRYEISEAQSGGLGGFAMSLNGAPIWPPKGEGCDKLVACCTSLAASEKSLGLACLMATGRDKTCAAAFATAIAVATEGSYALPASCAR